VVADAHLHAIIDAWPALPEPIRAGIVAMVLGTLQARGDAKELKGGQ
jgi:hypothetical protein